MLARIELTTSRHKAIDQPLLLPQPLQNKLRTFCLYLKATKQISYIKQTFHKLAEGG